MSFTIDCAFLGEKSAKNEERGDSSVAAVAPSDGVGTRVFVAGVQKERRRRVGWGGAVSGLDAF